MAGYEQSRCAGCGAPLTHDEIAIFRRLVCRSAQKYLCLRCFAAAYGVTQAQLRQKIQWFKEMGCGLF